MIIETGLSPTALAGFGLIFGLLIGSFLNVVILRFPQQLKDGWQRDSRDFLGLEPQPTESVTLSKPSSRCPGCGVPIKARYNVPVLSYLFLRGRCKACAAPISIQYPLVELLTAVLGLLVAWVLGPHVSTLMALILVYMLVALAVIDLDHKLLPDQLTLPLMWLGLIVNALGIITSLEDAFWGAVAGYLCLWLIYWGFRLATGRHGMG